MRRLLIVNSPQWANDFVQIIRHAGNRRVLGFALKVCSVVGVVLNLINQGPQLLDGGSFSWWHGVLNFVVPFCVSSFSGGRNELRNRQASGY
ncbi:hypothetical protein LPB72_01770 [Hydrogenophaga crassostreae]|uniref:Uncharacterized protein n=2 Tax=Hydrogenophaga crassostreae TaxID=1763535 RepID=A0A167J186_9BURK|nr:hypothetical protein LPB072_14050 [Hydrogenophaga crassostreae]OAD44240.1 hypothetical protein LPB72_01770 [Hydrogenophaga crassostreae]